MQCRYICMEQLIVICFGVQALISRGLQLEGQVVTEGQDLQALLERLQKSSLPFHSACALQDRVQKAVEEAQVTTKHVSVTINNIN